MILKINNLRWFPYGIPRFNPNILGHYLNQQVVVASADVWRALRCPLSKRSHKEPHHS